MARIGGNTLFSKLTRWDPTEKQAKAIQWALEARRLKIFLNRSAAGKYHDHDPNTRKSSALDAIRENIANSERGEFENTKEHRKMAPNTERVSIVDEYVAIIDLGRKMDIEKGISTIMLPFIPRELEYNTESMYVAIKPIGRNNPGYHYTGSEDKLEFEIDWHSFDDSRVDVIKNCRAIEALAKGNDYNEPPHYVSLHWGKDGLLFRDHIFVITSASYRLTQFSKGHMNSSGTIQRTSMLPVQAYQKVTLARVSSKNLSSKDIMLL